MDFIRNVSVFIDSLGACISFEVEFRSFVNLKFGDCLHVDMQNSLQHFPFPYLSVL